MVAMLLWGDAARGKALSVAPLLPPALTPPQLAQSDAVEPPLAGGAPAPPVLKLQVAEAGLYQVSYADLLAAGFDPNAHDVRTLKLHNRGREIPLALIGMEDGRFDATDALLFYGQAINDPYTRQEVYWLSAGGASGKRWREQAGTVDEIQTMAPSFPTTVHYEEETVYWQNRPGFQVERWFWGHRLGPAAYGLEASRTYPLNVPNRWAAGAASIRVNLQGYTALAHHTRLTLNDQLIDDQEWWGQRAFTHTVALPLGLLRDGENLLRIDTNVTTSSVDQLLVNWIEVSYQQTYTASNDQLWFRSTVVGPAYFQLAGVSNRDVIVLDITNLTMPIRFTDLTLREQAEHFSVHFATDTGPARQYFLTTLANAKRPAALHLDQPSTWQATTNRADYLIITSADFYRSALRLAAHRRATGMVVAVVKVEDLYDEFSAGRFTPVAIRDFLHYAFYQWQRPAPAYVVLLGDANQDYKDNLRSGTPTYVPSYNLESRLFGEVSSDNWFVARSAQDPRPLLAIGRLSAQRPEEADLLVDKIIQYEQPQRADHSAQWRPVVLHVADRGPLFAQVMAQLALQIPASYTVTQIYASDYLDDPVASLSADIVAAINRGSTLVTYMGHGQYGSWGRSNNDFMFDLADVAALHNDGQLPVVLVANCLNGFFAGSQATPSLAEALQRQRAGGAIAVWAPSGLGYPADHLHLLRTFYRAIFAPRRPTLGVATMIAKGALFNRGADGRELIDTYILFGDPALHLHEPSVKPIVVHSQ